MEEKKISERESLEIITAMIESTRERYIANGNIMLLWGYLTAVVTIAVWALLAATYNGVWNWLWFLIPAVGCVATPIMARHNEKKSLVKSYSDTVSSWLWTIAGISELVAIAACIVIKYLTGANCWATMLAYTLVAMPLTVIAQGLLIKEKSLIGGGMIALTVGIITVCCVAGGVPLGADWYMPLFILAFVSMMIVPGHILNSKNRRQ